MDVSYAENWNNLSAGGLAPIVTEKYIPRLWGFGVCLKFLQLRGHVDMLGAEF